MNPIIQVDSISKTFHLSKKQQRIENTHEKKKVAVNNLSFECYQGEIYGLLGPNGAGKTTTLRCISTLIKPDLGNIFVDSFSVKSDSNEVRKRIGFLTSDLKLEDFFTPNYLFTYFARLHGMSDEHIETRKKLLFSKFGIHDFAEVKVGDLSSGMRQKVGIAVSLVHDPSVIVFDEPTNGLDVITAKVVTDYLLELKKEGKTIILSTHIFSLVEKICDRVGIIIDGKLVYTDSMVDFKLQNTSLEDFFFELYLREQEAKI